MAKLIKREGSPYWYARFQLNGRDRWISTGKRRQREAQQEFSAIVAKAKSTLEVDEMIVQLVEAIEALPQDAQSTVRGEAIRRLLRAQTKTVLIREAWSTWCDNTNREYEPKGKTLAGYEAIWKRFQTWAESRQVEFLHEVTSDHGETYGQDLWKSGVSVGTFNAHIKFLRSVFNSLEARAGLVSNPWKTIKLKARVQGEGRRNLTLEELQQILGQATGNLRLMIALGLFTGLRLVDVVNLRWADINFDSGFLKCVPEKTSRFNKSVELPLHPALIEILRMAKEAATSPFVFPEERVAHSRNATNLTHKIQSFFQRCGIQTTETPGHRHRKRAVVRVGFHSLRHSFVSLCAKAGVPLHVIQKLIGHGSPMLTSDVYVHLDRDQKRQAIAGLPDIGWLPDSNASRKT